MKLSHSARKAAAGCCFFLSTVWGAAGVFKLIFGTRITFPLFPPVDLERVSPVSALAITVGFIVLGAWLGRTSDTPIIGSDFESDDSPPDLLSAGSGAPVPHASPPLAATPITRTPSV